MDQPKTVGESAFDEVLVAVAQIHIPVVLEIPIPAPVKTKRQRPEITPGVLRPLIQLISRLSSADELAKAIGGVLAEPYEVTAMDGMLWVRMKGFPTFSNSEIKLNGEGDYDVFDLFEKVGSDRGFAGLRKQFSFFGQETPVLRVHLAGDETDFKTIARKCVLQNWEGTSGCAVYFVHDIVDGVFVYVDGVVVASPAH